MATKKKSSKRGARKSTTKRGSGKRELIAPHGDKRYVRRTAGGQFKEEVNVGRSLAQDVRKHAKTVAKPGHGDEGDELRGGLTGKRASKRK